MKTKREIAIEQIRLQEEIQEAGFNIVECGHCGTTLIHRIRSINDEDHNIDCLCGNNMDLSDCPDLWYEGIQNNQEFQEDIN